MSGRTRRGVERMRQAIDEAEDFEQLASIRKTLWEVLAGDADFDDLMRRIEKRTGELTGRLDQSRIFGRERDDG